MRMLIPETGLTLEKTVRGVDLLEGGEWGEVGRTCQVMVDIPSFEMWSTPGAAARCQSLW